MNSTPVVYIGPDQELWGLRGIAYEATSHADLDSVESDAYIFETTINGEAVGCYCDRDHLRRIDMPNSGREVQS